MVTETASPTEQREQTDESLRVEREQVDGVLADAHDSEEESSDRAVKLARDTSDAALVAARKKADQRMEEAFASRAVTGFVARDKADQLLEHAALHAAASSATIAEERLLEDRIRSNERAFTDGNLRRERDENARILARLLPLERENTDRYLLTERARSDAAVSSRDDFLAMVSHDLRSLLGGIVLCADLLSDNAPAGDEGRVTRLDTEHIQRYAARMNRLIGDLVDVVSIDAGKLALVPAQCDSSALLAEAADAFLSAARAKGISLQCQHVEQPLMAELDRERVLQVLANLISNSMKFTARGGVISACVAQAGAELLFSVSDSGSGIAPEMLEAIFDRFWQAGKDDRRGLGLGLYIARCIVEAHGGRIWAESKLGHGSTIHFTIASSRCVE
ncbi:MAG: hypothetical protein JWN04_4058 [Myxococcaceae bacterium]|nr:hypothetical protein [Myxococcaceae bacterium]